MNRETEQISNNNLIELTSLCQRLIMRMADTSNQIIIEELANLYTLCMIAMEVLLSYSEISNLGVEGQDLAHLLGFDFSEKMSMIDDKINMLKKQGVSLILH